MPKFRRLTEIFSFSLGSWLNALLSFFLTPLLTLLISPSEFGKANVFFVAYNALLLISLAGADQAYILFFYDIRETERNMLLWNALYLSFAISGLISITVLLGKQMFSHIIFGTSSTLGIVLLLMSLILGVLYTYLVQSVRLLKKGWIYSGIQLFKTVLNFLFAVFYCYSLSKSAYAIILAQNVSILLTLLVFLRQADGLLKPAKFDHKLIKRLINVGAPFIPNFALIWLFQSLDRLTLRFFTNFNEIGLYSVAFKVSLLINVLQDGLTSYWIPLAYNKYSLEKSNLDFYVKSNELALAVYTCAASSLLLSKELLMTIFGKTYRNASAMLPFLILGTAIYALYPVTAIGINLTKKTVYHVPVSLLTCVFNFLGNLVLVPRLGGVGASISTGFSYILFYALAVFISHRLLPIPYDYQKIVLIISLLTFQSVIELSSATKFAWKVLSFLVSFLIFFLNRKALAQILSYFSK